MTREELLAKAKPILFSTEMVKAILDGRKTVTRRIIKPPCEVHDCTDGIMVTRPLKTKHEYCRLNPIGPPYLVGDILYVRETYYDNLYKRSEAEEKTLDELYYLADGIPCFEGEEYMIKWCPSIHMPKEAARIFLRVTAVQVGQLQEITDSDALKEGVKQDNLADHLTGWPIRNFRALWDGLNSKNGYGWEVNPWVWVISFERVM